MRVIQSVRSAVYPAAWWALLLLSTARGENPPTPSSPSNPPSTAAVRVSPTSDDPESALGRALDLERKRDWASAIRLYEEALDHWPGRVDFSHRLRLCETHLKIARRYQDQSFRDILLRLPRERALLLYDELLERIDGHYVDNVSFEPMVRRGLDNLEVALRDPNFLRLNAATADPEQVAGLRRSLRSRRERLAVVDRTAARAEVEAVCELSRQGLNLNSAGVVLEFIFGACEVLDTYTMYLTPDKLDDIFALIDGNFVGLGVELKGDPEGLRLVGVIRGGPASEGGLKVNDRIIAVEAKPLKGLSLDDAANRLQGEEGTSVEITLKSADGSIRTVRLPRRHVEVESVAQAKIVDKASGVGYIHLTTFQKTSTDELDRAIRKLEHEGMRYLVLDLRGNPGGLLNVAVEIADRFVDRGIIVSTRGRAPGQTQVYRAKPDMPYSMPMSVLIDHDSASASEILAGALKDLNRALVIGDRSYGKGSVQSIYELRSIRAGLKLTTAQFYSPTSRPYSEQGVSPDVQVRAVAKPVRTADNDEPERAFEFGDTSKDPVLMMALERARRQFASSR